MTALDALRERLRVMEAKMTPDGLKAAIAAEQTRPHPREKKLAELHDQLAALESAPTIEGVRAEILATEEAERLQLEGEAQLLEAAESDLAELKEHDAEFCQALAAAWLALAPVAEAAFAHSEAVKDARWRVERLKGIATIPMAYTTEGLVIPPPLKALRSVSGMKPWVAQTYGPAKKR